MTKDNVSKILFSLSETDASVREQTLRRDAIENERHQLSAELTTTRDRLEEVLGLFKEAESRRALEEHRLGEEEQRIIERRRQLTALGGAKSAKLVEREIDIATRSLESLEKSVMEAVEASEKLAQNKAALETKFEDLQHKFESLMASAEKELTEISAKLLDLEKEQETLGSKLDDRLKNLYRKVNRRYPGEAVAVAKDGSCRSCFRALPAQLYNQVMAGNRLLQCPGCSRILVYGESE